LPVTRCVGCTFAKTWFFQNFMNEPS
jgi:hypothetical protein